jgi:hypothetical protein
VRSGVGGGLGVTFPWGLGIGSFGEVTMTCGARGSVGHWGCYAVVPRGFGEHVAFVWSSDWN